MTKPMTESQKLDAWYAEQRASGNVKDIKFSLSASGREATVEALSREVNITMQLSDKNQFTRFDNASNLDGFLKARR